MPRIAPPVLAVALASLVALPGAAQKANPTALPATPVPSECRVEPRPVAFFADAVRRAVASPPPAPTFPPGGGTTNPTPIAVSEEGSHPADPETVAAVTATARERIACINAGDLARFFALYTEQSARSAVALLLSSPVTRGLAEGTPAAVLEAGLVPDFAAFVTGSPVPFRDDERADLVAVANVRVLPDGRVVADTVSVGLFEDDRRELRGRVLFAEEGGRFRIVGDVVPPANGTAAATPAP